MVSSNILPPRMHEQIKHFFSEREVHAAYVILQGSQIELSFMKESAGNYFIVSGIVNDKRPYETRLTYKNINADKPSLNSTCSCEHDHKQSPCIHVLVLLLKYFYAKMKTDVQEGMAQEYKASIDSMYHQSGSVFPKEYGGIIHGPGRLENAFGAESYGKLQYLLCNGKIVNFPIPRPFQGKLKLILRPLPSDSDMKDINFSQVGLYFHLLSEEGNEVKEVSLFESLYLFNWQNGDCYHLPESISNVIKKIMLYQHQYLLIDYLRLVQATDSGLIVLSLYEKDIRWEDNLQQKVAELSLTLSRSSKKNFYDLTFVFEYEKQRVLPPGILRLLSFEQGLLESFEKKSQGIELAEEVMKHWRLLEERSQLIAGDNAPISIAEVKIPRGTEIRALLTDWLHFAQHEQHDWVYDEEKGISIPFDLSFLRKVLVECHRYFSYHLFRFARYDVKQKQVVMSLPTPIMMENMANFHQVMSAIGVPIYFDNKILKRWKSSIRLERNRAAVGWFDFDLHLSDEDLKVVQNIDLNHKLMFIDDQLVLIDDSQRDLILMLQEYMKNSVRKNDQKTDNKQDHVFNFFLSKGRIFEVFDLYQKGIDACLSDEEMQICQNLLNLKELPQYEVPSVKDAIARSYQVTGYQWLRFLYESRLGACLADDMGLGKTLQAIMFLKTMIDQGKVQKVLILCPVSIILNWKNEFEKFSELKVSIYYGDQRIMGDEKIILTSYGILKKEIDQSFKDQQFDVLIMDEVQNLKNIKSQGAVAARKIEARFRIGLTGTPVENDISEFYNIIDLCIPGIWKNKKMSKTKSTKATAESIGEGKDWNQAHARLWAKNVSRPFILRRTKAQVLTDLPEKIENTVYLSFSEKEKDNYQGTLVQIRENLQNISLQKKYGEVLKSILRLRQLCLWQDFKQVGENAVSTKMNFLMETLVQIVEEGHSVLIISQFTSYLDLIEQLVRDAMMTYSRIDGKQSMKRRQSEVDQFQSGKNKVFLISLKAGGVGLNLTKASYIFLMDPWWNPAVENQAIDRAYRIGQQNNVTVYRPIIKDSVEEKVLKLQEFKKELFHDLMNTDGDEYFSGRLTLEDFEEILGG